MHARVYEVWHSMSLVHTAFCICHNPLSATLRQADNSREDQQPNLLHSELGRSMYKQHVTHTHTYTAHTHIKHTSCRDALLTPSPGSLQRVVVQFSRTQLSEILFFLTLLTLALSPWLLQSLIFFLIAGHCHNRCKHVTAFSLLFFHPLCSYVSEKQSSTLSHKVSASPPSAV